MTDASLIGSGLLAAAATQSFASNPTAFGGSGLLAAAATLNLVVNHASFGGNGSLSTAPYLAYSWYATFVGVGSLSAGGQVLKFAHQHLAGSGKMCVQATVRLGSSFGAMSNLLVPGPGATQNLVV